MGVALFIWFLCTMAVYVIGYILCSLIEKSGVEHWGATGKLWKY